MEQQPDVAHTHVKGVVAAMGMLVITVAVALVLGGMLLFGVHPDGSPGGPDTQTAGPTTTSPPRSESGESGESARSTTSRAGSQQQATAGPAGGRGEALCIGDSVMLSAFHHGAIDMCGEVDAALDRGWSSALPVVRRHEPYPEQVVIHLGTNGFTSAGQIDAVLSELSLVPRVVLVNVQLNGTKRREPSVNVAIAAAVARRSNVRLADWKATSSGHATYFRADGIHPTAAGARAYGRVIARALDGGG